METESVKLERKVCTVLHNVAGRGAKVRPTFDEVVGMGMSREEFMLTLRQMVCDNKLNWPSETSMDQYSDSAFFAESYTVPLMYR